MFGREFNFVKFSGRMDERRGWYVEDTLNRWSCLTSSGVAAGGAMV